MLRDWWPRIKSFVLKTRIAVRLFSYMSDSKLSKQQWRIFKVFLNAEDRRYKRKLVFNEVPTIKSLFSFCMFKHILMFFPTVMCADSAKIKTRLCGNLYSIVDTQPYSLYYWNVKQEKWLHEKWYKNGNVPIIVNYNNKKNIVLDGNHRLAQQIYRGEVRYMYIDGDIGWNQLFKKMKLWK